MTSHVFLAIFDLCLYHVRRFLPYNLQYFGAVLDLFWTPPYLPLVGRHLWMFPYTSRHKHSTLQLLTVGIFIQKKLPGHFLSKLLLEK